MTKKNLLLISLDCARADVIYTMKFPAVAELVKDGAYFTNAISSAPITPVSHATVLTGLQPYHHGIRHLFKEKLSRNVRTIQQVLRENGYATGAIVSSPGLNRWYGFGRGFETYDDEIPKLKDGSDPLKTVDVKLRGTALKPANVVSERATAWLERHKDHSFGLFVHFFDAHWPYSAPDGFGGKNAYERSLGFVDHHLGMIIKELKALDIYKNTTIVCFSDHGEDLNGKYKNDKGGKRLGHPEEQGHGCLLYEPTQRVVLIIKDPAFPKGRKIESQVGLVDIFPTILDMLKLEHGRQHLDGISLVSSAYKEPRIAYSETFYPEELDKRKPEFRNIAPKEGIRISNRYKVIFNIGPNTIELYDLKKDPYERHDLNSK